jgi:hypothetical protein
VASLPAETNCDKLRSFVKLPCSLSHVQSIWIGESITAGNCQTSANCVPAVELRSCVLRIRIHIPTSTRQNRKGDAVVAIRLNGALELELIKQNDSHPSNALARMRYLTRMRATGRAPCMMGSTLSSRALRGPGYANVVAGIAPFARRQNGSSIQDSGRKKMSGLGLFAVARVADPPDYINPTGAQK